MDVTSSPSDGNTTMMPPAILLRDSVKASPTPLDDETVRRILKQKELEEFYSTYDVWTGIRTAITLSLFFIFSVTIILYKSRCKPRRKYELYPSLEDMPGRPLDYYDYWSPSPVSNETGGKVEDVDSLGRYYNNGRGSGSAPLPTKRSVGSYSSLNNSFRVKSLPGSVMRMNWSRMSSMEREEATQVSPQLIRSEFLRVPGVRLQSTGSSSDGYSACSSSHDFTADMNPMALLGVPGMPPRSNKPLLQLGGMDWDSDHATAEWVQTIDINVIQPTPNISPCGSVRSVSDHAEFARLSLPGRGRIASVLSLDSPDFDSHSVGSDSVFMDDSVCDTGSSFSESIDSTSPSYYLTARSLAPPSPRSRHKIQSYRLGINNPAPAPSPASSGSIRTHGLHNSHRHGDQRSRQKLLQRQQVQDIPVISSTLSGSITDCLQVPSMGGHLNASCERLAAHTIMVNDVEIGSNKGSNSYLGSNRGSNSYLTPGGSMEDEPMCASFTVPALRRTISATTPEMKEEATGEGWRRSDSAQAPCVKRADSASAQQAQSSESSSESDDASESVSFHLMVPDLPELSIDYPSFDTVSRASTPTLSPPLSPLPSPLPTNNIFLSPEQPVAVPVSPRGGMGRVAVGRNSGKRMLRRQYSQCMPASPTLNRDTHHECSLPTYLEEDDRDDERPHPPAPPSSPHIVIEQQQQQHSREESSCPPSPSPNVMETSC